MMKTIKIIVVVAISNNVIITLSLRKNIITNKKEVRIVRIVVGKVAWN